MVDNPDLFQDWADWPIRLYKCASSLLLFGFEEEFESVRMYALRLISEEKNFWYDGKDCSELFRIEVLYANDLPSFDINK